VAIGRSAHRSARTIASMRDIDSSPEEITASEAIASVRRRVGWLEGYGSTANEINSKTPEISRFPAFCIRRALARQSCRENTYTPVIPYGSS
jgi:hypothetical protein